MKILGFTGSSIGRRYPFRPFFVVRLARAEISVKERVTTAFYDIKP